MFWRNSAVTLKRTLDKNLPLTKVFLFFTRIWTVSLSIDIKASLLRAYISTQNFDVICISETYLDSDRFVDNDNLENVGYNLIGTDHSCGVCICCKYSLAFELLNIHYLKECINFEILFGGKICNFISLYY